MLADEFCNAIAGARVSDIRRRDFTWFFDFDHGWTVATETYWRVLTKEDIAASQTDDGQMFGLPRPFDARERARLALGGTVTACSIDPVSGDLSLRFSDGGTLQAFNTSAGYEGWRATDSTGRSLVAVGGGEVVTV
jgi:hypothetical protein